jgi:hypothetical protein
MKEFFIVKSKIYVGMYWIGSASYTKFTAKCIREELPEWLDTKFENEIISSVKNPQMFRAYVEGILYRASRDLAAATEALREASTSYNTATEVMSYLTQAFYESGKSKKRV